MATPFVGQIQMFAFNYSPAGWAKCDGQLIPINQNQALFSLLGTTFGGDGKTTFALPDLRGRTSYHFGNGNGLTPAALGQKGGAKNATLVAAQLPSHSHNYKISCNNAEGSTPNPSNAFPAPSDEDDYSTTKSDSTNMMETVTTNTGNGQSFGTQGPYLTVNFCIALQGVYPPRT